MDGQYNPEAGLPVTGDSAWEHPDVMERMWTAGDIQEALSNAGFTAYPYDETMSEPCRCVDVDGDGNPDASRAPLTDCAVCGGKGVVPLVLRRSKRWVNGKQALRVPSDAGQIVSPYLAACVSALLVKPKRRRK